MKRVLTFAICLMTAVFSFAKDFNILEINPIEDNIETAVNKLTTKYKIPADSIEVIQDDDTPPETEILKIEQIKVKG